MSSAPAAARRIAAPPPRARWRRSLPHLHAGMASEIAFRVIARGCLEDLTTHRRATCSGDQAALHDMRVALTRLRAALSFFSPMVDDIRSLRLKQELRWLNGQLGRVRDLDVAIERWKAIESAPHSGSDGRGPDQESAASHQDLARTLQSIRYRQLIERASDWIEHGPWSTASTKRAQKQRARPIDRYSKRKLTQWREKLLKRAGRLAQMSSRKRHRIRLANKRLRYCIEFFAGLLADETPSLQASLKHLRKAQQALGELNDACNGQSSLAGLPPGGVTGLDVSQLRDPKREKQLLHTAIRAYRQIDQLGPLFD